MDSLSQAMSNSLSDEIKSLSSSVLEIGIDSIMNNALLKEFPLVSTVMSVYNIGHSLREIHYIKKLQVFICELNNGIINEQKRAYYKDRIQEDRNSTKEIEYLLLLIDRYIHCEKAQMLAKVYLSFLDGIISWRDCAKYAEVIDRFLPGDRETLLSASTYKTEHDMDTDSIQRLIAQGLVIEGFRTLAKQEKNGSLSIDPPELREKKERNYARTEFGNILVKILTEDIIK